MKCCDCLEVCVIDFFSKNLIDINTRYDVLKNEDGDITLFLNEDKSNIINSDDYCICDSDPSQKLEFEKKKKLEFFKHSELYPLFHYICQKFDPPITDEELAELL